MLKLKNVDKEVLHLLNESLQDELANEVKKDKLN